MHPPPYRPSHHMSPSRIAITLKFPPTCNFENRLIMPMTMFSRWDGLNVVQHGFKWQSHIYICSVTRMQVTRSHYTPAPVRLAGRKPTPMYQVKISDDTLLTWRTGEPACPCPIIHVTSLPGEEAHFVLVSITIVPRLQLFWWLWQ